MPKRKKNPKLPSGWGSIRYLGKGRTLPYAVHPPAKERDSYGRYIRPAAICYVPDWYTGFAVLSAYHAGTYEPGLELTISREVERSSVDLDAFCKRVMKDHGMAVQAGTAGITFSEAYNKFMDWKFGENAPKALSASAKQAYSQGHKHLKRFDDIPLDDISVDQLQSAVNECEYKKATRENIVLTAKQVWKFALSRELCEKDTARFIVVPDGRDDEHGVPFTDAELVRMWKAKDVPAIAVALIMCYSGFRIGALKDLEINIGEKYFRGGLKTAAGKNRVVPIYSAILPLVKAAKKPLINKAPDYRQEFYTELEKIGIKGHTPHDCRHTFSRLCESYGVREADRKRMMGHSFGGDITNAVYGHRTIEELRTEIEKIRLPDGLPDL